MTLWSKIQGHSDLIFIFNTPSCPTTKYEGTRPYDKKVLSLSNLIFDLVVKGQGLNDQMLPLTLCHVLIPIHIIYEGIGSKEQKFLHWTRLCLQRDDRHHVAISLPPQLCFGWGDVVVQQSDDNIPSYDLVGRRYETQNCRDNFCL